jgi:hypothetical protein
MEKINISRLELQRWSLEFVNFFLKYLFRVWDRGFANSVWDNVTQISYGVINFQDIHYIPNWTHLLLKIKFLFSRNNYVCPIWIFIFDTNQIQIYSVFNKLILKPD